MRQNKYESDNIKNNDSAGCLFMILILLAFVYLCIDRCTPRNDIPRTIIKEAP